MDVHVFRGDEGDGCMCIYIGGICAYGGWGCMCSDLPIVSKDNLVTETLSAGRQYAH